MNKPPLNSDQFADTAELPVQKVVKPPIVPLVAASEISHEVEVMPKRGWRWPLIGSLPLEKQAVILRALAFIFIFTAAVLIGLQYREDERQTMNADIVSQVQINVVALQNQVESMLYARRVDVSQIKNLKDQLNVAIPALAQGGLVGRSKLSPASGNAIHPSLVMLKNWQMIDGQLDKMIKQERSLTALKDLVGAARNNGEEFLRSTETVTDASAKSDTPTSRLALVGQSLIKNIYSLALSPQVSLEAITALNKESDTFSALLPATRSEKTQNLKRNYEDIQHMISLVASDPQALSQAKTTGVQVLADLPELAKAVGDLSDAHRAQMWPAKLVLLAAGVLALLTFYLLWSIDKITSQIEIARRRAAEEEKEKTQQAIRLLIEEIKGYADGDLTVRASVVTGKITEPLARTVNHTFEELGKLVKQVNSAAGRVTQAAVGARATSNELLQASESQNNEIQKTSRSVLNTVEQMHMVAARASESAKVALTSLEVADKGSRAVANSIRGMDDIRGRIQDTSKRLKRLGESSQEIGEIVALISDITEQTNVLALNAAIQAANAGEAGRGFGVVAEEVQRLAERSNEATQKIEVIVHTIQKDAQDAIGAMETSIQRVAEGAQLSDAAGQALDEITTVSNNLTSLIQNIAAQMQEKAEETKAVDKSMNSIRQITEQTEQGTKQTVESLNGLQKLAGELKNSTAKFRL